MAQKGEYLLEYFWKLERILSLEPRDEYNKLQGVNIARQHFATATQSYCPRYMTGGKPYSVCDETNPRHH